MEALCEALVTTVFLAATKPSDYPFAATVVALLVTFTTPFTTSSTLTTTLSTSDLDKGSGKGMSEGEVMGKGVKKSPVSSALTHSALMTLYRSLQPALTLAGRDTRISDGSKVGYIVLCCVVLCYVVLRQHSPPSPSFFHCSTLINPFTTFAPLCSSPTHNRNPIFAGSRGVPQDECEHSDCSPSTRTITAVNGLL